MRTKHRETSTDHTGKERFPYESNDPAKIYRMNKDKQEQKTSRRNKTKDLCVDLEGRSSKNSQTTDEFGFHPENSEKHKKGIKPSQDEICILKGSVWLQTDGPRAGNGPHGSYCSGIGNQGDAVKRRGRYDKVIHMTQ